MSEVIDNQTTVPAAEAAPTPVVEAVAGAPTATADAAPQAPAADAAKGPRDDRRPGKRPFSGKPKQERPKLDFTEMTTNLRLSELDKDIEGELNLTKTGSCRESIRIKGLLIITSSTFPTWTAFCGKAQLTILTPVCIATMTTGCTRSLVI